jgi:hypothetical protein
MRRLVVLRQVVRITVFSYRCPHEISAPIAQRRRCRISRFTASCKSAVVWMARPIVLESHGGENADRRAGA